MLLVLHLLIFADVMKSKDNVKNKMTNENTDYYTIGGEKETFFLYFGYSWLIGIMGSILLMELIQNTYEEDDGDSTRYQFSELSIRIQCV